MARQKIKKQQGSASYSCFAERLQYLIDSKKINQARLAAEIKVGESRVSNWLSKKTKNPRRSSIVKIANYFGVDPDWLQNGGEQIISEATRPYEELKYKTAPASGRITTPENIPVVGKVPAGYPNTNEWEIEYTIQVPGMPKHCYALLVTGDSMEPRIKEGEHVIFVLDYTLKSGDVVVVTDEYGDSMVKRYKEKDGKQYLVSDNRKYDPVEPNDGFNIVGKVISSVLVKKH